MTASSDAWVSQRPPRVATRAAAVSVCPDGIVYGDETADWTRVRQYYFHHDGARRSYEEHTVVIEAIGERDPNAAAAAMQDHLRKVSASLLSADPPFATPV